MSDKKAALSVVGKSKLPVAIEEYSLTPEEKSFLNTNGLYYENGSYRTPCLIPQLAHNELIMRGKKVLIIEKKGDFFAKIPLGGAEGSSIEHLLALFDFLSKLKLG